MTGSDHEFALCLTHDVDRPYKTALHSLYYAVRDRDPGCLRSLAGSNPYWQFERIADLEERLGVRSAFYFLPEPAVGERSLDQFADPDTWVQLLFRYDVASPEIRDAMRRLADGGWEVGLHGSYHSPDDRDRLAREKELVEAALGDAILGGRQHYLNLSVPDSWRHHRAIGLRYDASFGTAGTAGFQHGYDVRRPFDDAFAVFPLTLMETDLPDPEGSFAAAWDVCESLLDEAADNDAVMTALWHPRFFATEEFPGYADLYRRLVETALDRGAWVGSPGAYYERFLAEPATAGSSPSR